MLTKRIQIHPNKDNEQLRLRLRKQHVVDEPMGSDLDLDVWNTLECAPTFNSCTEGH